MKRISLIACVLGLFCVGCSTFIESTIDKAANVAGEKVGERVGDTVGTAMAGYADASLRNLSPALMQLYVSSIFSAFFYSGGYNFQQNAYEPGEWTRWKATGMDEGEQFEKAFLKQAEDGSQWWQIVASSTREGEMETVILEALFSAPDESGSRNLLRLRSLFPGDEAPAEVPVQKDTAAWYNEPAELTQESLEAATTGIESITVPAGAFEARHIVYRDVRGMAEWWLNDDVPGGIVKYQITNADEEKERYIVELSAFGKDAKTRLQSF